MSKTIPAHAVILAGGRGTRFWPRSRTRTPKQLLNIIGKETMLQQTVARLAPVFPARHFWVVTNDEQSRAVRRHLPRVPAAHILSEPVGRNTAAAIGLAAIHLQKRFHDQDPVMAILPADHFIGAPARYQEVVRAAVALAAAGPHLVTLGVVPTHPESGYGYIERASERARAGDERVYGVKRFTEKPTLETAMKFVTSGEYYWNAGMFFWRASTFLKCLAAFLPKTLAALLDLQRSIGTARYTRALRKIYPELENISVDFAVMEPATRPGNAPVAEVLTLHAEVGWSDIGSWSAVYDLLAQKPGENVSTGAHAALDASGNFFWSPKKFVGAIGVRDLILVETDDALLLCPRGRSQDVAQLVKWLEANQREKLL
jgi:mannose-1-phosphate guanylyltransferase